MDQTVLKQIEAILDDLRPFESLVIQKDQLGRPNKFMVKRSQEVLIQVKETIAINNFI